MASTSGTSRSGACKINEYVMTGKTRVIINCWAIINSCFRYMPSFGLRRVPEEYTMKVHASSLEPLRSELLGMFLDWVSNMITQEFMITLVLAGSMYLLILQSLNGVYPKQRPWKSKRAA